MKGTRPQWWAGSIGRPVATALKGGALLAALISASASSGNTGSMNEQPAMRPRDGSGLNAEPSLISENTALVAGRPGIIAITFALHDKWHLYWPGQNDTGMAPQGRLSASIDGAEAEGFEFGAWQWPSPKRYVLPGDILDYVYWSRVTLLVPVTPPESAIGRTVTFAADLEWLVCDEACVLEKKRVELSLPVVSEDDNAQLRPTAGKRHIDEARQTLPRPFAPLESMPTDTRPVVSASGDVVTIRFPGARELHFLPHADGVRISNALSGGKVEGDTIRIELDRADDPEKKNVKGVLQVLWRLHTVPTSYDIEWTPEQIASGRFFESSADTREDAHKSPGKPG